MGTMGRGREKRDSRLFPLPILPRAVSIFRLFLLGYPAGAYAEESWRLVYYPPPAGLQYNAIILYLPTLHLGVIKNLLNHVYESKTIKKKRN